MRSSFLLLGVGVLQACSTSTFTRVDCTTNSECRAEFGLGTACGNDGFCEVAELHPRCETVYPPDLTLPIDPSTTLVVGSVFDHSSATHVGRYQSAQLAAIQADANDGLDGRDFAMIHCTNTVDPSFDDLDKTAASEEAALWLADTVGVPAIIGPAASSRTEVVYNAVANAFDTLVISPSATSPSLTPLDGTESTEANPGLLWRTAPPDDLQAVVIAQDMLTTFDPLGADVFRTQPSGNVGVVYQTGAYGEGLQAAFTDAFVVGGGTATGFPFSDDTGRSDSIAQAANQGFDEILFISSDTDDIIAFLQGAATLGSLDSTPIFLPDAARNADVLTAAAQSASSLFPNIRGTAPANPAGAVFDSFKVSYAAEYGGDDISVLSFTAQSFDAMWLVIYGHAWATYRRDGNITGTNIARGLRRVSNGVPVNIRPSDWNLVKANFQTGTGIDVFGASGALDYASDGETTATIDIWVISQTGDDFDVVGSVEP